MLSMSSVEIPGLIILVTSSSAPAAMEPAILVFSKASKIITHYFINLILVIEFYAFLKKIYNHSRGYLVYFSQLYLKLLHNQDQYLLLL